ncbi:MAG: phosphotriesterase-related protein [Dehalococcoidia bacterium]
MTVQVQTVLGPIGVDDLGLTLMHEHLKVGFPGWQVDTTLEWDRDAELEEAVQRLQQLKALGVATFVDPCAMELARDPDFMAEVSRQSGVNIVCSTGLYLEHGLDLAGFPAYFRVKSIEQIQRIYTTELTRGIGPDRVRPGIIKVATGPKHIGDNEEKSLRAAARTAQATDVRITTHTTMGTMGNEQMDIFLSEGMQPHHVVIGHCDWNHDPAYHRSLLERGCYIGFDGIGIDALCPDEVRIKNLVELTGDGFARQIVLSHDNIGCWHFSPGDVPEGLRAGLDRPKRRYTYLIEEFIPRLLEAGVSESTVHTMMVENPRRYFAGEAL